MRDAMKGCFLRNMEWWAFGLVGVIFCISCAAKAPAPISGQVSPATPSPVAPSPPARVEAPAQKAYFIHTVRFGGETVSIIAAWYTEDIENWKALAEANPNINPNRIFVGHKILIPEELLKTRESMPKEFVDGYYRKKENVQPSKRSSPAEEEEPKLFGPKGVPQK